MPNWSWPEFEWDDNNSEHIIERHNVYPEDAEQAFYNGPYVRREGKIYRVYGQDDSGRYLLIICVLRGTQVRVISARDMDKDEKRTYARVH